MGPLTTSFQQQQQLPVVSSSLYLYPKFLSFGGFLLPRITIETKDKVIPGAKQKRYFVDCFEC